MPDPLTEEFYKTYNSLPLWARGFWTDANLPTPADEANSNDDVPSKIRRSPFFGGGNVSQPINNRDSCDHVATDLGER